MENVILKVSLSDGNALNRLAQIDNIVKQLNGRVVSIKTDKDAETKIQQQINALTGVSTSAKNAAQSAGVFERAWMNASDKTSSYLEKLGTQIGSVNVKLTQGTAGFTRYIRSMDGMRNATVKADGVISVAGDSFQRYTATVKNSDGSFQNYTYAVNRATGATYQLEKGVTSVDTSATHMGDTFGNLVTKIAKWAALTTLVYTPVRAFKNAVDELKNVDTELVTIQKVTNYTAEEMQRLAASAYDVAAAYGSTASNYLNSVSEFAKAGYSDLSASLGQLALKTQVVGDVDKETANQFLLSVDAAYQYAGSVEKLGAVLDGANELGNKYATSVQKIAEGMGIVSSVAKSAHTDVGDLAAAIGTITAVTQRSGTEAARALRAIYLNILGNTQITLDDDSDETWTAEEIQAMSDALTKFNIATRETVDGVEKLRDPMAVIGDMAAQWKAGVISEAELNDLIQDLGGKLRSNQLLALIQNWDMFESMRTDFANAAGSADQEFDIYLNSWEAKLNQLSAAWTKFVSEFGIEDFIKDIITLGTNLLNLADNGFVHTAVEAATLVAVLVALVKIVGALKGAAAASRAWAALSLIFAETAAGAGLLNSTMLVLNTTLLASPLFWVAAGGLLIFSLVKILDNVVVSVKNLNEAIEETNGQIDQVSAKIAELEAAGASETVIDIYRKKLSLLKKDLNELSEQKFHLQFSEGEYFEGLDADTGEAIIRNRVQNLIDRLQDLKQQQSEITSSTKNAVEKYEELEKKIQDVDEQLLDYYLVLAEAAEAGYTFTETEESLYMQLAKLYGSQEDVIRATVQMAAAKLEAADDVYELIESLEDEAKQAGMTKDELVKLVAQAVIFNNTDLDVSQKIAALQQLAAQAGITSSMLNGTMAGDQYRGYIKTQKLKGMTDEEAKASYWQYVYDDMFNRPAVEEAEASPQTDSGRTSASSKGKSGSKTDKELERLKDVVSLRKSELSLMQERGDSTEDQIAKMREIQAGLHAQAEYLRSIGGDQADINALSTEHWKITNEINDLLEEQAEAQKKAWEELEDYVDDILDKAKDARDERIAAIDEQIDGLKKAKEEEDDLLTLEEKRLAVEKARKELLNAQNERTVRQIQADGSWEWVADQSAVQSAQDALDKAEDELKEFEQELAYNAVIDSLEAEKERINQEYDAFEAEWEAIKDSIAEPSRDIAEILADISENGAPAMQEAVNSVTEMLDGLAQYIGGATGAQKGSPGMGAGADGGGTGGLDGGYSFGSSYNANTDYLAEALKAASSGDLDAAQELWQRRGDKVAAQGDDRGTSQKDAWDKIMDAYAAAGGSGKGDRDEIGTAGSGSGKGETAAKKASVRPDMSRDTSNAGKTVTKGNYSITYNEYGYARKAVKAYDSGGVAKGLGVMVKDTTEDEIVLGPETTRKVLDPGSNEKFISFTKSLGLLFGTVDRKDAQNAVPGSVSTTDRHDVNYFINGVKVGNDMADQPLSRILSVLPIHTESN